LLSTYTGFESVGQVGLIFGRATSSMIASPTTTLGFTYTDGYTGGSGTGSLTVVVNRLPTYTSTGTSYSFGTIDTSSSTTSTNIID
jgi:hypothetical protein